MDSSSEASGVVSYTGREASWRLSRTALAALILGILSLPLFFLFVPAMFAVCLGELGLTEVRHAGDELAGRRIALAGLAMGVVSLLMGVGMFVRLMIVALR